MDRIGSERLYSLDLLRGLDMVFLTVVGPLVWAVNAGWGLPQGFLFQFTHPWEGFTAWDIIMPLFLFMCGAAIPLSLERRIAVEGTFGTKAMWDIPQTFAWGWLGRRENKGQRAPTKFEMSNMFWQMVAGGANGLIGYCYAQISDKNEDPDDKYAPYFAKVCGAAAEVKAYERVLLSDGEPPTLSTSDDRLVCRAWREADGRTYVLAVNSTEQPLKASVSLSEPFSAVVNPELGPAPRLDGSSLSYDLPGLGYVMLRLVK